MNFAKITEVRFKGRKGRKDGAKYLMRQSSALLDAIQFELDVDHQLMHSRGNRGKYAPAMQSSGLLH